MEQNYGRKDQSSKNNLYSLILFSFMFISCHTKDSSNHEELIGNVNAPLFWGEVFPLKLQVAENFSFAEHEAIEDMTYQWEKVLDFEKNLFSTGSMAPSLEALIDDKHTSDGVLGVYKLINWPESFSKSSLAVTVLIGTRYNKGKIDEHIRIHHADIFVNYHYFKFRSTDGGSGFDLRSILIHELGHFLGLVHAPLTQTSSVMYPYISSRDNKRIPTDFDANELQKIYSPGAAAESFEAEEETGDSVKIIID